MGVFAVGQFSGAHLNPAVSLALALDGSFDWSLVPGYIVAQMLGAIVGATVCTVNAVAILESDRK